MAKKKTKKNYTYAVGRRREATARVRLYRGDRESLINEKLIGEYFPGVLMREIWRKPFVLTNTLEKFYITVRVVGGGKKGQLGAVVHGTAKALSTLKPDKFRTPLKKAGLLTRDPRIRERRKVGTGGRARRKKQSPKR